ncbi:hypothetical protein HDG33_007221 [Paraburkholderia sp. Cpub6]|nr:hypothetical protein [Paraburkholderia sp. Cpub6]
MPLEIQRKSRLRLLVSQWFWSHLTELDFLKDRLSKAEKSAHLNFSSEDFFRMSEERTE